MQEQHSPLEQFQIKEILPINLGGFDASFTNASTFMVAIVVLVSIFVIGGMRNASAVPNRWQSMVEMVYEFISNMLYESAGPEARKFFPFIFSLFMFILFANLIGMIPYTFTVTSHIAVTFAFAIVVFLGVTITGFAKNGMGFLKLFMPSGTPLPLTILLIFIELISYLVRPMSLSVRLFANMMAGHTLLKVLAGFIFSLGLALGWLPLIFITALTGLEIIIAILQAYVFAMLTCIYLNDAYHPGH